MTLSPLERADLVAYRIDKAIRSVEEAKGVGSLGFWSLAANRLYYAAYYASIALLINEGIVASTHRGAIRMTGLLIARKNLLSTSDSKLLSRLFAMRQSGDYEDLFDWEENDVIPLIPKVEDYISRVKETIYSEKRQDNFN